MEKTKATEAGQRTSSGSIHFRLNQGDILYKDALGQRNALYAYAVQVATKYHELRGLTPADAAEKAKDEVDALIAY
jgi:hypothetical protein